MTRRAEHIANFERGRSGVARAQFGLGAWILLWAGIAASAQTTYLPSNLSSGTYQSTGTVTNCTNVGPPPTGCTGSTLNINAQVILEAGSKIVLGPGFTANATNSSTSLIAIIGTSNYVPVTVTTAPVNGLQLTVDGISCTSPCNYTWIPNYNHTIATASPQNGPNSVQLAYLGWSDGEAQSHTVTAPSSPGTYTASFQPTASYRPTPLILPTNLKGLGEYFPRGHAWWSMLYDWYTEDCAWSTVGPPCGSPGANTSTVAQMVAADLQMLHTNGINFIHLYLWDQDIVQSVLLPGWQANHAYGLNNEIRDPNGHTQKVTTAGTSGSSTPSWNDNDTQGTTTDGSVVWTDQGPLAPVGLLAPGFVGWDNGGPEASPGNTAGPGNNNPPPGCPFPCNQWSALQAFVSLAQQNGIWVSLEFAVYRPGFETNTPPSGKGYTYQKRGKRLRHMGGQVHSGPSGVS